MRALIFGLGLALLALPRLILLLLPGLGRDEAAYLYWSRHPEFSYAPLMGLLLRGVDLLPGQPEPWMLRMPGFLAGGLGLWLLHRLCVSQSMAPHTRNFLLLSLTLSPWSVYVGSIVHPDAWLLPSLLGAAWAAREERRAWLVSACILAAWSKPVGLLLFPLGLAWLSWRDRGPAFHRMLAGAALSLGCLPVVLTLRASLLDGVREFSQIAAGASWQRALALGAVAFVLLCGPALLLAGIPRRRRRSLEPTQFLSLCYFAVFAGALLAWAQVKASWILPAWTLSAVSQRASLAAPWKRVALFGSAVSTVALSLALSQPRLLSEIENRLPALAAWYPAHAGARELRVSSATSWSDRAREYAGVEPFADDVRRLWGRGSPPAWIASDDYGLCAQLLAAWPAPATRMLLSDDEVFRRETRAQGESTLVLSVRRGRSTDWIAPLTGAGSVRWLGSLAHPTAEGTVWIGRLTEDVS